MPKKLSCRMSKCKEEGLVVLETLKDKSIFYSRNRVMTGVDKQEPDLGKAL